MKPVEARNTIIKLTRSPSASPPRPSPGSAHSPRSVERRALDSQEARKFFLFWWTVVSLEYQMMWYALLQAIEISICEVKWWWSLNGFHHRVFFIPIHLDIVDGSHRDVGRVGSSRCFLVPAEEVLDLQGDSMELKFAFKFQKCFRSVICLYSSSKISSGKILHLVEVISAIGWGAWDSLSQQSSSAKWARRSASHSRGVT